MSITTSKKRRGETQIINDDEVDQTHQEEEEEEEEEEEDCQMIPELPTHIVFDILSRLLIKTLFNCRSVCKLWLSLISSDPQFAKLHLSRSHPSLLFKPINRIREPKKLHLVDLQIAPYTHPRNASMKLAPKSTFQTTPESQLTCSTHAMACFACASPAQMTQFMDAIRFWACKLMETTTRWRYTRLEKGYGEALEKPLAPLSMTPLMRSSMVLFIGFLSTLII
ncbi:hypothetical protein LOK49_LG06G01225 [Camellia lanceoleosa]|uniref:Uncharacterized protein n=1 Tax=Camellia lanceoleosa TaxID=1840588 RepID=A0ACC0HFU5_9ERIC|nr:hypothetical protein LOK49_LG06G01225 [Camellia lanceoleosa]